MSHAAGSLTFAEIVAQQPHNKGYSASPVFTEGEKVYAFHQNMLYEAKVTYRSCTASCSLQLTVLF